MVIKDVQTVHVARDLYVTQTGVVCPNHQQEMIVILIMSVKREQGV
jgi:hypothetical protein